jgi:hypothetical protein
MQPETLLQLWVIIALAILTVTFSPSISLQSIAYDYFTSPTPSVPPTPP